MASGVEQRLAAGFATVAARYCQLLDDFDTCSAEVLICALHGVVPELLFRASVLPDVEPEGECLLAEKNEPRALRCSLGAKLGQYDQFCEVFDPVNREDRPISMSLSDSLSDIYRDLKRGLRAIPVLGEIPSDVIWDWRFHYKNHWGPHALEVYRVLHSLLYRHGLDELAEGA